MVYRQPEVIEASEVGSHFESDFLDSLETRCTPEFRELPDLIANLRPLRFFFRARDPGAHISPKTDHSFPALFCPTCMPRRFHVRA